MNELTDQEVCVTLKKLYDESENRITTNAVVSRAYIDKTSTNTINDKVNAQMNSIKAGIYGINPKFKEGSKNYDSIKQLVTETLAAYEQALVELSEFYDGKIEQLILRKVELEASLVGTLLNEEYLRAKILQKSSQKDNDKVKMSVKDSIKSALEKLKEKKNANTELDPLEISKLLDQQDVAIEIEQKLTSKLEKAELDKKENYESIEKIEKEIAMITDEIERINDRKKKSIYDAMEVGEKTIAIGIRRPKVIKKITKFFVSRFNTAKMVESSIIDPLRLRIESFKTNELASKKG